MEHSMLKNINKKTAENYISNTDSEYLEKTIEHVVVFDTLWIDKFEETLPYIDLIIRNPRKFIAQEEEVTIVEKTKRISEESIRHLAKHSSLVHEVDEEGFVKPAKLLNVYKEETYDLCENRFLYTLIKKLYTFIQIVLNTETYESSSKQKKIVNYTGETLINDDNVKISLNIEINPNKEETTESKLDNIIERINSLRDIIYGFMNNPFVKSLSQAAPVKSPIIKTNVFLKEQNFKKALELWEFLEVYMNYSLVKESTFEKEETDKQKQDSFDFINYLSYNIISPIQKPIDLSNIKKSKNESITLEQVVMDFDGTEKEFKKMLDTQYRIAINKKKKNDKEILDELTKVIVKFNKKKKMALK